MPTVSRDFVNRTDEIAQLDFVLNGEGIEKDSLVVLHGQEGMGKTQLLAKYLRIGNFNNIRIAYVDLSAKDYLKLIDEIVEGLGKEGFEALEQTYDEVLDLYQPQNIHPIAVNAQKRLESGQDLPASESTPGIVFNQPVSGEQQFFVNGPVTFKNPKITQIFNFQQKEPEFVPGEIQRRITLAFHESLRTISREQPIAILLDNWDGEDEEDEGRNQLKIWLNNHLLKWASEFTLKKALVVLSREVLPKEFDNQAGILPLAISPFNRETALKLWQKYGLPESLFNALGIEAYSIPGILALEINKEHKREAKK